jgi:hypothetical protein
MILCLWLRLGFKGKAGGSGYINTYTYMYICMYNLTLETRRFLLEIEFGSVDMLWVMELGIG